MSNSRKYAAYIALAAVCLIWGTTYLALRIAVEDFPAFLFSAIRHTTAGVLLLTFILIIRKAPLPTREQIIRNAIGGFFMLTLGNGLVAWGEMHVPSGIASIICSMMPMMVILINLITSKEEKPTVPIMIGVVLGLVGIIIIFGEHINEFSKGQYMVGMLAIFGAVVSWAGGSIWIKKRNADSNPFVNAGLQMFFSGLWCLPLSLFLDDYHDVNWSAEATYALIYLIIVGSIIGYASFTFALRKLPMTIVSMYAYINPLVAVLLGWIVLDEKISMRIILAFILTLAGIYVVNRGYHLRNEWKAQLR